MPIGVSEKLLLETLDKLFYVCSNDFGLTEWRKNRENHVNYNVVKNHSKGVVRLDFEQAKIVWTAIRIWADTIPTIFLFLFREDTL